jgi:DNA-binding HxlR family transcriptional regulator
MKHEEHSGTNCKQSLLAVKDALDALSGKWKLPIIIALSEGPKRFKELQRTVEDITPKILSKELKELELNDFVTRHVYDTMPVSVEYELTQYSHSLDEVITSLYKWGLQHRKHIHAKHKKKERQPA